MASRAAIQVVSRQSLAFVACAIALMWSVAVLNAAHVIVVGAGRPGSCTEVALWNALSSLPEDGGMIRFSCGDRPVTIDLVAAFQDPNYGLVALPIPDNTTIDGDGLVTLEKAHEGISVLVRTDAHVTLKDLSFVGRSFPYPGDVGIVINAGTLTIQNSTFADFYRTVIRNDGTLIVKNSTFSGIGGFLFSAIVNNGRARIGHSSFVNNLTGPGGIVNNLGTLDLEGSAFSNNSGTDGPGAISNKANLAVDSCEFTSNYGDSSGAIYSNGGTSITVKDSTFVRNSAGLLGGAMSNGVGTLTVVNSKIINNSAQAPGGGIHSAGPLIIRDSDLSGNHAGSSPTSGKGGGVYATGPLTVVGSTITQNVATFDGGGIYVSGVTPTLRRTTVTGNSPNDVVVVVITSNTNVTSLP